MFNNDLTLVFNPISRPQAEEAVLWEYRAPYDIYNISPSDRAETVEAFLRPDYHYYAVLQEEKFVAFRCFGADAQVPGGDYSKDALDMGGGLRPDLTGRGLGRTVLSAALNFGVRQFSPKLFRTTVAEFNLRAVRVCTQIGYCEHSRFFSEKLGRSYIILLRSM